MPNENKYYVYLHIKKTDNQIFYVGKGCGYRSNVKTGRTKHWQNIVNKHGYYVDFYKKNISSSEAKKYEKEIIKSLRDSGVKIVNITSGGDGGLDCEDYTKETREKMRSAKIGKKQSLRHAKKSASAKVGKKQPRDAVEKTIGLKRKPVINSIGQVFVSASDAARSMSKLLGVKCSQGNISMVCRGGRSEAYGYSWSYEITKTPILVKRKLICSNGMSFETLSDALNWVVSWRGKGTHSNITNSIFSGKNAYGYKWTYKEATT